MHKVWLEMVKQFRSFRPEKKTKKDRLTWWFLYTFLTWRRKSRKMNRLTWRFLYTPPNFVGGVTIKLYLLANCYQRAAINGTGIITSVFKDILICLHRLKIPHPYLPHRNTHIPKPLTEIFQPGVENIWSPLPPIPVPKADKTADSLTEVETPVAIKKSTSFSVKEAIPVACRILPAVFKWMDNLSVRLIEKSFMLL